MLIAEIILLFAAAYALVGLLVSISFVMVGMGRVDAAARGAPWGFRIFMVPGCVALWPVVLTWWIRAVQRAHGQ